MPTISSAFRSENSTLSSAVSSPPNTRCNNCRVPVFAACFAAMMPFRLFPLATGLSPNGFTGLRGKAHASNIKRLGSHTGQITTQLQIQDAQAKIEKTQADAAKSKAEAEKAVVEAQARAAEVQLKAREGITL